MTKAQQLSELSIIVPHLQWSQPMVRFR